MRVLVVDDDPDLLVLLQRVLSAADFEVVEAPGGREALTYLNGHEPPDVVVLDIQMPHVDGWDTLTALRADPRFLRTAVIMCTAQSAPANKVRGWELGCDAYVTKPFETKALISTIREVTSLGIKDREARRAVAAKVSKEQVSANGR